MTEASTHVAEFVAARDLLLSQRGDYRSVCFFYAPLFYLQLHPESLLRGKPGDAALPTGRSRP